MNVNTRIHNVTRVEKTVTVHHEGEPSQFIVVDFTVFYKPWNAPEQKAEFTLFVEDDANPLDVIGNGEFTYVK
jgi:hypothetical protein